MLRSHRQAGLLDPELVAALQHHVLPRLSAVALGHLSCACKDLHRLVAGADEIEIWRSAAADLLHATHPALASSETQEVRQALSEMQEARSNIKAGICSYGPRSHMSGVLYTPLMVALLQSTGIHHSQTKCK